MRGVLKFKILRFIAKVKRKLADIENRFRDDPPHRLLGLPMMFGGFFLVILGVFMLVFPGPGILAILVGVAGIIFGFRVFIGYYCECDEEDC